LPAQVDDFHHVTAEQDLALSHSTVMARPVADAAPHRRSGGMNSVDLPVLGIPSKAMRFIGNPCLHHEDTKNFQRIAPIFNATGNGRH